MKRYVSDGAVVEDLQDAAGSNQVYCGCGYLKSDEESSANHEVTSRCTHPDDEDYYLRLHRAAKKMAAAENKDHEQYVAEMDDDDPVKAELVTFLTQ